MSYSNLINTDLEDENINNLLHITLKKKKKPLAYPSLNKITNLWKWQYITTKINDYLTNFNSDVISSDTLDKLSDDIYKICNNLLMVKNYNLKKYNKKINKINKIISKFNLVKYQPKFRGKNSDLNLHFQYLNTNDNKKKKYITEQNYNIKTIDFSDFTINDLNQYLELRKSNKSNYDGLCLELIRKSEPLKILLLKIFNYLINNNIFPKTWSCYFVYNFYKGNGDTNNSKNFRPIVKLDTFSKLFWAVINEKLKAHISNNNIINKNYQKAFQKNVRGVEENLYIHQKIKLLSNQVLYLDIKNAYGSISPLLVKDTLKYYRFPEKFSNLIYYYLKNRYAFTEECFKKWNSGLPQGLCLSNQLFILCMNYIVDKFYQKFKIDKYGIKANDDYFLMQLFADDIVIYSKNLKNLQKMINYLSKLIKNFDLKFNELKSYIDIIQPDDNCCMKKKSLKINGIEVKLLNSNPEFKYLGQYADLTQTFYKLIYNIKKVFEDINTEFKNIKNSYITDYIYAYRHIFENKLKWFLRVNQLTNEELEILKNIEQSWILDIDSTALNYLIIGNDNYFNKRYAIGLMSRHQAMTKSLDTRVVNLYKSETNINHSDIEFMINNHNFKIENFTLDDGLSYN
jgi:hypothetical protein